jgi:hypothetical protein
MGLAQAPATAVQHDNGALFYREQDSVLMRSFAVNELTHLKRKFGIFGCQGTALRELRQRKYRFPYSPEPA